MGEVTTVKASRDVACFTIFSFIQKHILSGITVLTGSINIIVTTVLITEKAKGEVGTINAVGNTTCLAEIIF